MFAWLNFFQKVIIAIGAWLASQIISLLFIVQEGYADIYNADGSFNRREKLTLRFWNGITTAGINNLFNVYFGATSKAAAWYMGLIASSGYSALAAADTMSSHADGPKRRRTTRKRRARNGRPPARRAVRSATRRASTSPSPEA